MTPTERKKAIATAVAVAASHPMLPREIKLGFAAIAEELDELRAQQILLNRGGFMERSG